MNRRPRLTTFLPLSGLGRKSLLEARALARRIPSHFGLQQNRTGFGLRIPPGDVGKIRDVAKPQDGRFDEHNKNIAGRLRFRVLGFPEGSSASEVCISLREKLKWTAIVGAPSRRGGHLVFPVSADTSPPTDVLHLKVGPILVRPLAAADARTASAKPFKHRATRPLPRLSARAASQEARPRPPALPSGNSTHCSL